MSDNVNNPLDDDEHVGGLLKSLISTSNLQATWQSVAKRLQAMEKNMRRVQQTLHDLPQQYVQRQEFVDRVETHHAKFLNDHEELLKQHEDVIQELTGPKQDAHGSQKKKVPAFLTQEQLEHQFLSKLDSVEKLAQDLGVEILHQMETSSTKLFNHLDKLKANAEQLKKQVEDNSAAAAQSIREAEHNMQISTEQEINQMVQNLCDKSSPEATQLLRLVATSLVEPLAAELNALTENLAKQEESYDFVQRSQAKAMSEMVAKLQETRKDFKEQINFCTRRVELAQAKQEVNDGLEALSRENDDFREKMVVKLTTFADLIGKVQTEMWSHEHCLQHHAEEIENRSTKYDMLVCRNEVEKCVLKRDFQRELGDIQRTVSWQSGKIENFDLNFGMAKPRRHLRRSKSKLHQPRSSVHSDSLSEVSDGNAPSVEHQPIIPRPHVPTKPEGPFREMLGIVDETDDVAEDVESELERVSSRPSVSIGDDSASESSISGSNPVLQQQLEAVAMGLLGLAHLALKKVRLGTSRNSRLIQEKEMLEELANVRHWITNRIVPPGWDASKLTTLALRCTYPREDDMKGPLPQVSLKNLQELNRQSSVLQTRNLSSDPRNGPKIPCDSRGDASCKPPLSARGHSGGTLLPPLE